MSSPNHPTSNIEDAFSSNFPNYIPASSDYVPASPGKTYFESSNNSFGLVPIASPTLSLIHGEPYMKVMHAYYAKELPIPPPFIMPPSLLMPPKRNSASAASASEAPAMNQDAIRNHEPREAHVARKCSYKEFMSCQPINFKGSEGAVGLICWFERTELVFSCSNCTEDCKMKFTTGDDLKTYVRRFQELATLCPTMVSDSEKMMEAFIGGLMLFPRVRSTTLNDKYKLLQQWQLSNSAVGTLLH
nr:reverse transcriptase domain-containing protein [Tanacetum cinerariifolium]